MTTQSFHIHAALTRRMKRNIYSISFCQTCIRNSFTLLFRDWLTLVTFICPIPTSLLSQPAHTFISVVPSQWALDINQLVAIYKMKSGLTICLQFFFFFLKVSTVKTVFNWPPSTQQLKAHKDCSLILFCNVDITTAVTSSWKLYEPLSVLTRRVPLSIRLHLTLCNGDFDLLFPGS